MKKRIKYMSVLAVVVLIATCFEFGSPSLQPARARALQDGDVDGADFLIWHRTLGTVPGQVVRITVANPADTRSPGPVTFQCMVFDPNGVLVFQTERREVPPRGFRYEDIVFGDLGAIVGEPGTGRKQVLIQGLIQVPRGTKPSDISITGEVLDQQTGRTSSYWTLTGVLHHEFLAR
jgi:hypothetical protein